MLYQDFKNLISFIKFNNLLDVARPTRQQSSEIKFSNIVFVTLVIFYN